jgi:hypothetical protein
MATSFTITKLEYANTATTVQTWTLQYKAYNASSYILINSAVLVNTDGTLLAPQTVSGLTAGQLYYVQAYANCTSPIDPFIQQIQL